MTICLSCVAMELFLMLWNCVLCHGCLAQDRCYIFALMRETCEYNVEGIIHDVAVFPLILHDRIQAVQYFKLLSPL